MKFIRILFITAFGGLLSSIAFAHDRNAPLDGEPKAFLSQYESVRAALASDDLAGARKAAAAIATDLKTSPSKSLTPEQKERHEAFVAVVEKIASAESLAIARDGFRVLSKRAIHYAEGKEGYYIANCPMVPNDEGNWVQTTTKIGNPYFGKSMLTCGNIKK